MNFFKSLMSTTETLNTVNTSNITKIVDSVKNVMFALFGLLTVGAVILAVVLAYKFFTASDETKRKNAKAQLIYAIIGIVALVAVLIFVPQIVDLVTKQAGSKTSMFMF